MGPSAIVCVLALPLAWGLGIVVLHGQWLMCAGLAGIVRKDMAALHQLILQKVPQFPDGFDHACNG